MKAADFFTASYKWTPATTLPGRKFLNSWLAVSVPGDKSFPNQIAEFRGNRWVTPAGEALDGVTFWAHLPDSPEQMAADAKQKESSGPVAAQPAATRPTPGRTVEKTPQLL